MSMKPEFLCCIGAELKDEIAGSLKSSRIFLYRAAENQTIADMLADGFFNDADDLRVNDLILLYCPEQTRSNTFAKVASISGGIVKTTKLKIDPKDAEEIENAIKQYCNENFVKIDGTSVMSAPLRFTAGSLRGAVGPSFGGVEFYTINNDEQHSLVSLARMTLSGFLPYNSGVYDFGSSAKKWRDLYLSGKAYVATINNGADLSVPAKSGTLATTADVELAARSGRMLTDQGVWYAKMHSETVAPSAEDGTNYADFSQVDGNNNPIIVIYERQSGAWVLSETITPPAEYDGYVSITSKIWDIVEQSGQQGGRVLWNHTSKEFTPDPVIISTNDIQITGNSTVIIPANPGDNQIINKKYLEEHAGASTYHPDLFDFKWTDHTLNDVQWLRADTFSWQPGSTYEPAFWELFYDIQISTNWYREGAPGYTAKRYPEVGDTVYLNSDLTTPYTTVESYDSVNDTITAGGNVYTQNGNTYVTPTTETVAGYTVSVYTGHSGRKITIPTYETAVSNIYTATGVAWYYILDIPNKRFKLPRSKHEHYGDRPVVGNGKGLGINNGTDDGYFSGIGNDGTAGTFSTSTVKNVGDHAGSLINMNPYVIGVSTDSTKSGLISTPVQDTDQYKYLYFYVGSFTQTALENTAGLNAELFNSKVDISSLFYRIAPDYAHGVETTATTSEQTYTCPSAGWVVVDLAGFNNNYCYLKINDIVMFNKTTNGSSSIMGATGQYFVSAGDVCKFKAGYDNTFAGTLKFTFYPCKGA